MHPLKYLFAPAIINSRSLRDFRESEVTSSDLLQEGPIKQQKIVVVMTVGGGAGGGGRRCRRRIISSSSSGSSSMSNAASTCLPNWMRVNVL